jgi:hypothetical protein
MMIISSSDTQQDTLQVKNFVFKDSARTKSDSASFHNSHQLKDTAPKKVSLASKSVLSESTDTTSVCIRNSISDVTFFDSSNVILSIKPGSIQDFPFIFTEKNRQIQLREKAILTEHLKPGMEIPSKTHHEDWVILALLVSAFLFSLVRRAPKSFMPGIARFFLYRGISDPASRDIGGLFHWQSTILNLVSFLIVSLFGYMAAQYYDLIPHALSGIYFWLICLGIIISAVTLRHIVCTITGIASSEREVFREYLIGVYQSYRFSALLLFILIILMSYTSLFPSIVYIMSGIIIFGTMYLIRIIRLLIIFLNRNISIFYLILYLCALEILPVLVSIKYFSGLA